MGDPREPTDPAIIQALRDGVRERMGYPAAVGLPELREAVARWVDRRFGVELDPDAEVIPTLGSKEAIFSFAQVVLDVAGGRDTVVVTEPGYPVPGRGAAFAGARVVELPLLERNGFLPDLDGRARRRVGAHGARLAQHAEQPDRRRRPARAARRPRAARARARLRARVGRGVLRAVVRRAAALGAAARRPDERRRVQHALEALVDDRLPQRVRRRRSGARRRASPLPAERRHRAAGVRAARLGRRVGRRGARRASPVDLCAEAGDAPRRARPQGPARRRRPGDDVPLDRRARGRDLGSACCAASRARRARDARLLPRAVGRGLRALRARPDGRGVRPGGRDPGGCAPDELCASASTSCGRAASSTPRRSRRRSSCSTAASSASPSRARTAGSSTSGRRRRSSSTSGSARSSRWSPATSGTSTRSRSSGSIRPSAFGSCRRASRGTARTSRRASC